jgi:hypothetical protein
MQRNLSKIKHVAWDMLRSPKTVAFLKLGAAVVGVIHAIDELTDTPRSRKSPVGFRVDEEE